MRISAIFAMSDNRVIGRDNQLPWRLPADLRHFKAVTLGKPVIMGRKTYDSIGGPLPGRLNIVVTHKEDLIIPGVTVVHSPQAALAAASTANEVFIIGGAQLFKEFLPRTERIYLTIIHAHFDGDAYLPALPEKEWQVIARADHEPNEESEYRYSFLVMERRQASANRED